METGIDSVVSQNDLLPLLLGGLPVETLLNCVFVNKSWMNILMNPAIDKSFWTLHYAKVIGGKPNTKKSIRLQVFAIGRIIRNSKKDLCPQIKILIGLGAHKALNHILTNQSTLDLSKDEDAEKAGYPLHMAVSKFSRKSVEVLVSHGCSAHLVNKNSKKTPKDLATKSEEILFILCPEVTEPKLLFLVLEAKKQSLAIRILQTKNFENEYKQNMAPLHLAAKYGLMEVLSFLIHQRNVPVDQPTTQKVPKTALQIAAESGQSEAVAFLLQNNANRNANPGKNAFLFAVDSGVLETIKTYLKIFPDDLFSSTGNGNSGLHIAASNKNFEVIRFLVKECSMDINWRTSYTPLEKAVGNCRAGDLEFLENILQLGVDVTTGNPIELAIMGCAPVEVISWLISKGANINGTPQHPPLLEALCNGKDDIVDLLIESGADLFLTDSQNRSVYHCFDRKSNKRLEHVKLFLEKGVPSTLTTYNENPIESSMWCRDPELVKLLLTIVPPEIIQTDKPDNLVCKSIHVTSEELFHVVSKAGVKVPKCALYDIVIWLGCPWETPPSREFILEIMELNPDTLNYADPDRGSMEEAIKNLQNEEFKQMITELIDTFKKKNNQ
eukprot:TRINITY_DN9015_c0_g1_i1.p1 TRINITY_DN9015_c0_g1~~TRINITY_DN9015_c0_g1_i1.p1  ORF type:complete len:611 (+),score=145.61 TRINITY_DN9015_c0_g1_i1:80-1912(+)